MNENAKNALWSAIAEVAGGCEVRFDRRDEREDGIRVVWRRPEGDICVPDTVYTQFLATIERHTKSAKWGDRFSMEDVAKFFTPVVIALATNEVSTAGSVFNDQISRLDGFSETTLVHFHVDGLSLRHSELKLDNIHFFRLEAEQLQQRILDTLPNDWTKDDKNEYATRKIGELSDGKKAPTIAEVTTLGFGEKAIELALEQLDPILDFITFAHGALLPYIATQVGVARIFGKLPNSNAKIHVTSSSQRTTFWSRGADPGSIWFDWDRVETMEQLDLVEVFQLSRKRLDSLSEIERGLRRSLQWFSKAQAEDELANQLLCLVICLETLLSPPREGREPISATIAESVAILIAHTPESRIETRRLISGLYDRRSSIAHGSEGAVTGEQVAMLRSAVVAVIRCLSQLSQLSQRIANYDELRMIILRTRMGDDEALSNDERWNLEELIDDRELSVIQLAERSGVDVEILEKWDEPRQAIDLGEMEKVFAALDIEPAELIPPYGKKMVDILGHRFLLESQRIQSAEAVASVKQWKPLDSAIWPVRPIDPEMPGGPTPYVTIRNPRFQTKALFRKLAIEELESRLKTALEVAVEPNRLESDPEDWTPFEPPRPR